MYENRVDRHTYKNTHTQTKYRNPRCACAPRVSNINDCLLASCDGCKTELVDENCHASETVEAREQALMLRTVGLCTYNICMLLCYTMPCARVAIA